MFNTAGDNKINMDILSEFTPYVQIAGQAV